MDRRSLRKRAVKKVSSILASYHDDLYSGPDISAANLSKPVGNCDPGDQGQISDSDDESQNDDDIGNVSTSLTESLCDWALHFRVSLVALTALLAILRLHHPFLPKDARTLLKTTTSYSIHILAGGTYHYFGKLSCS